jgi:hypothetical protein
MVSKLRYGTINVNCIAWQSNAHHVTNRNPCRRIMRCCLSLDFGMWIFISTYIHNPYEVICSPRKELNSTEHLEKRLNSAFVRYNSTLSLPITLSDITLVPNSRNQSQHYTQHLGLFRQSPHTS